MKSPRIKLYKQVDGFNVYVVDGSLIRKSLDDQFTNFGQHYRFPHLIPMKEFWIDVQKGDDESEYFIAHMLKEWELMRKGKSYDKAIVEADEVEHSLRNKDEHKRYKIKKLDNIGDISVWLVNGRRIRDDCYTDFTEGGHDLVYPWIPDKEIWLDNDLTEKERAYVLAHEYDERVKMEKGQDYEHSHNQASFFERHLRHKIPNLTMKKTRQKGKERSIIPILGKVK